MGSDDYGRDLTGVNNLKKKHRRLEAELGSHEPTIRSVQEAGQTLIDTSQLGSEEIRDRLSKLDALGGELKDMSKTRERKLGESVVYQNFLAKIDEEEAWIAEKQNLMAATDVGSSMAAVQGLMKKHDAFDNDLKMHDGHVESVCHEGQELINAGNHHGDAIADRLRQLVDRMAALKAAAQARRQNLLDNSSYMQFMWKADVVESWIADKEAHVRSDEFGRDLSSVQTLLTKQETFDIGLESFEAEGIANLTELKQQLSFR